MKSRKLAAVFTALLITAGAMTVSANAPYTDISGSTAKTAIDYMYDSHCLTAFTGNEFHPGQAMTRGDLAQMMYGVIANFQQKQIWFKDVKQRKDVDAISAVTERGIMHGYPDGSFRTDEVVTREAFAVAVYNYLKYYELGKLDEKVAPYSDEKDIAAWAKTAADVLHSKKIYSFDGAAFQPQQTITRGEAAAVMYSIMKPDPSYVSHVAVESTVLKCLTAQYGSPVAFFDTGTLYWQGDTLIIGTKGAAPKLLVKRLKEAKLPAGSVEFRNVHYGRAEYDLFTNRAIRTLVKEDSLSNYVGAEPDYATEQIILTVRYAIDPKIQTAIDQDLGAGRVRITSLEEQAKARTNG